MEILTNSATVVGAETITGLGSWQHQMKTAIRDLAGLRKMLGLPEDSNASTAESVFSVFAPLAFVGRIERGNAADPLLLQLLPRSLEDTSPDHFSVDPLLESNAKLGTGVLKKYAHRALMIVTGACAIHCRYCFRRQFPYQDHTAIADDWKDAVDAIAVDSTIHEVILSGGDPLTVVDARLESLVDRIAEIQHVRRLRIHTRLPIMIPSRVTDALVGMLSRTRLEVVVVIHSNHAREIDGDVAEAMKRLTSAGAILLNQSVLLAGVNDDAGTLIQLSNRLLATGVLPYYLHQLDQVIGTSHFEVPVAQGIAIVEEMRTLLPGFAVPRYVQEIPGRLSKTVLA
jgi:EF-P beta-lysylation protein EpmB